MIRLELLILETKIDPPKFWPTATTGAPDIHNDLSRARHAIRRTSARQLRLTFHALEYFSGSSAAPLHIVIVG